MAAELQIEACDFRGFQGISASIHVHENPAPHRRHWRYQALDAVRDPVLDEVYADLEEAGIIAVAKVVRIAPDRSVSIASVKLPSEAILPGAAQPEEQFSPFPEWDPEWELGWL